MILRNEKYSEITCQNINLHSSAVCTISIRVVTLQRQRILLDKCLMFCQARAYKTYAIYAYTQKWQYRQARTTTWRSHWLHCEVEIVQSALEVASEVRVTWLTMYSLLIYKSWTLCQNTSLDALSKHACKPSPAEHIRTSQKEITNTRPATARS